MERDFLEELSKGTLRLAYEEEDGLHKFSSFFQQDSGGEEKVGPIVGRSTRRMRILCDGVLDHFSQYFDGNDRHKVRKLIMDEIPNSLGW